ncbi:hypothetical protein ACFV84_13730 [Kitasatospora sp. NPDC059811]|uniref:hypothetical protein n=1 Tax=Streptomycetaceae TaxID=2062 RepID=UPI0007AF2924|nr:hypothetical protein [Streptomyces sp. MJM8645]
MSDTTTGPAWLPLLEDLGETFNGCLVEDVAASASMRPEATAWFAADAVTSIDELAKALTSSWSLHTPEQAGAIAAALISIEHHVAQAKSHLLDVLDAMEERGDVAKLARAYDDPDAPPAVAADLFKSEPSPQTADRVFAKLSSVPMQRPMPETFAEALHQVAALLADLAVPGNAIEIHEEADHPQHQGFLQLQHQDKLWRLGFYDEEWFLDDYPAEPAEYVVVGRFPLLASHPLKLADATRAALNGLAP